MKKWYVDPTYQNYAREMKEMGLIPKDWSKHPEYVQLVCDAADYGRQIRDRTFTRKDKIKAFLSERAKEPIKKQPSNDFTLGSYNTRTGKFQPLEKTTNESSISVQESVSGTMDTFTHAHDTQTSIQNTYIA
ncbi:MAG: hypothetical protein J7L43_00280, partial [Candidatus Aenigmarchaeota archaeon]|nr:hypothetical protein [Candidatus Aenigmarchaeota archaeon]